MPVLLLLWSRKQNKEPIYSSKACRASAAPKSISQKYTENNFVSEKPIFHSQGMGPDGAALGRPGVGFGVGESMWLILDFKNGVA
jgi:hypothetical protein